MTILRTSVACCLTVAATLAIAGPLPSGAATGQDKPSNVTFVVIGDVPYGAAQIAAFPGWIDRINAQPGLDLAFHVGDIKNGSSPCTDAYNQMIREQFDRFEMPLLYTPGDNEWTDCHRPAAGGYDPLERLDAVRATFFETPGRTLGSPALRVSSQADLGLPENQSLRVRGIEMATLHVVGSNNDRAPWTGLGLTTPTDGQLVEEAHRMSAVIESVEDTFDRARQTNARAVVLFQQADMFDPLYQPGWDLSAFQPLVQALVDEASTYDGEVYLFDGDSHVYNVDRPLAAGSRWLAIHGVTGQADNLVRVTVDGEANNTNFLQVTVNRPGAAQVLAWTRVPYADQP
ncbi:hypothetical protein EUA06_00115 [Nocardioides glacieisoli]|uniref:Uncharacterized protein n=1 Tax=Nocardioides glacieisoli TaxID=1168730 RepID=A0A4Q2S6F9_9ACTN|nr:metallophosphoesterase [Nocardioides glacieisoli]RYB96045.1 hypothetical protein EUA06_00115 [Nocardioides glacieisoli]